MLRNIGRYGMPFSEREAHVFMLANFEKYRLFAAALAPLVDGKRVVDIGAGSGILSLVCFALGASHVLAIERPEIAESITKQVLRGFGNPGAIDVLSMDLFDVAPEKFADASIIVSETIGYLGFEENIAALLAYARAFAPRDVILVPHSLILSVEAVALNPALSGAPRTTLMEYETCRWRNVSGTASFALGTVPEIPMIFEWNLQPDKAEYVSGLMFSFNADLSPVSGCNLSNAQRSTSLVPIPERATMNWPRFVVPFAKPVEVQSSDRVEITLALMPVDEDGKKGMEVFSCRFRCVVSRSVVCDIITKASECPPPYRPCGNDVNGAVAAVLAGLSLIDRFPKRA
jgi:predicted RNA methylase